MRVSLAGGGAHKNQVKDLVGEAVVSGVRETGSARGVPLSLRCGPPLRDPGNLSNESCASDICVFGQLDQDKADFIHGTDTCVCQTHTHSSPGGGKHYFYFYRSLWTA